LNIRLGERDLEIFTYMARLRMLTMNQMAALFYEGHPLPGLELKKANGAMRVRVSRLMAGDFVRSAPLSFARAAFLKGYFLGPNGIAVLKDTREYEDYRKPRWIERKHTMCLLHGPHHVIVNNFLINLPMLSRCREGFEVLDWLGDRDATFRFTLKGERITYDPDLYVKVTSECERGERTIFLEVDRDTTTIPVLRRKIYRAHQYYLSREYKELTGGLFPRLCFLVPDEKRTRTLTGAIMKVLGDYKISTFPCWISTFDEMDVFSIDQGRVTDVQLVKPWVSERGRLVASPLI
jgi:Replication-relaxation